MHVNSAPPASCYVRSAFGMSHYAVSANCERTIATRCWAAAKAEKVIALIRHIRLCREVAACWIPTAARVGVGVRMNMQGSHPSHHKICTLQSMPAICSSTSKKKPCMPSGAIASRKTSSTMETALKKMNCSEHVRERVVSEDSPQPLSCSCTCTSITMVHTGGKPLHAHQLYQLLVALHVQQGLANVFKQYKNRM
jgi:hypothetical protein